MPLYRRMGSSEETLASIVVPGTIHTVDLIRYLGGDLTYAELDRRATRLAAGLAGRGLRRGDRLATLTQTSPDHVATLFACARLGVALLPISWRLAPAEVAHLAARQPPLVIGALARMVGTVACLEAHPELVELEAAAQLLWRPCGIGSAGTGRHGERDADQKP